MLGKSGYEPKWYISFEPARRERDRIYRRETKTFPTEAEAKAFARMILDRALSICWDNKSRSAKASDRIQAGAF